MAGYKTTRRRRLFSFAWAKLTKRFFWLSVYVRRFRVAANWGNASVNSRAANGARRLTTHSLDQIAASIRLNPGALRTAAPGRTLVADGGTRSATGRGCGDRRVSRNARTGYEEKEDEGGEKLLHWETLE